MAKLFKLGKAIFALVHLILIDFYSHRYLWFVQKIVLIVLKVFSRLVRFRKCFFCLSAKIKWCNILL